MMGDPPSKCISSTSSTSTLQQTHYSVPHTSVDVSNDSIKEREQHKQISITTTSFSGHSTTLVQTASSVDSIIGQQQHEIAIDSDNFLESLSGLDGTIGDLTTITGHAGTQSSGGVNCNAKMEVFFNKFNYKFIIYIYLQDKIVMSVA
jgi:hypothetical protein